MVGHSLHLTAIAAGFGSGLPTVCLVSMIAGTADDRPDRERWPAVLGSVLISGGDCRKKNLLAAATHRRRRTALDGSCWPWKVAVRDRWMRIWALEVGRCPDLLDAGSCADASAGRHGWIAGPSPVAIGRDGMQICYRSGLLGPGNHDNRKRVAACYRP